MLIAYRHTPPLEIQEHPSGYIHPRREEQDPDLRRSWILSCLWTVPYFGERAAHHFVLHQIIEDYSAIVHNIVQDAVYLSVRTPRIRSRPGC